MFDIFGIDFKQKNHCVLPKAAVFSGGGLCYYSFCYHFMTTIKAAGGRNIKSPSTVICAHSIEVSNAGIFPATEFMIHIIR